MSLPLRVEQRAARISRVDGGVGAHDAEIDRALFVRRGEGDIFRFHGKRAFRHGNALAFGIAYGKHFLAHAQRFGVAYFGSFRGALAQHLTALHPQHRDVVSHGAADVRRGNPASAFVLARGGIKHIHPAVQIQINGFGYFAVAFRVVNHVIIGNDIGVARVLIQFVNDAAARGALDRRRGGAHKSARSRW